MPPSAEKGYCVFFGNLHSTHSNSYGPPNTKTRLHLVHLGEAIEAYIESLHSTVITHPIALFALQRMYPWPELQEVAQLGGNLCLWAKELSGLNIKDITKRRER